jgi:hypothetical protein
MKIIVEMSDVVKGVDHFFKKMIKEFGESSIDISDVDYDALLEAIQDEFNCGCDGSVVDVINDLNDSVGLEDFGIHITL